MTLNGSEIPFKLLILDIDGVMTTGAKHYDRNGDCVGKSFNDRDFSAINRFKEAGVKVCFLSGSQTVNRRMASRRDIDFFYTGPFGKRRPKEDFIKDFKEKYGVTEAEMAFVGDDMPDVGLMSKVGFAYCPWDAPRDVQEECIVLDASGGDAAVANLYDVVTNPPIYG